MGLYLFKEQFRLVHGRYEIALYVEEVEFEVYKCPKIFEAYDTNRYKYILEPSDFVANSDKCVMSL